MKFRRRSNLLVEPPSTATGDIAFNLIVFFLVCVAITPDTGRKQDVPSSEQEKEKSKPIEVLVTRRAIFIDGNIVPQDKLRDTLDKTIRLGAGIESDKAIADLPEKQRLVVVSTKDNKDAPYETWIAAVAAIQDVGAVVTLQIEEERTVETD